ncbi:MAG: 2-hydroxyacyl-CoA dehydratase [Paludibacteraceae bacterium]|nr:2-hydroxyacyl-CoA dehydratase [Paludibacteraceae bacterium]
MRHLDDLLNGNGYTTTTEVCPGCENHCTVKRYLFDNGQTYHSGNQCEKIYSNTKLSERKGFNMFAWKNMLLFRQDKPKKGTYRMRIGIPRALGIYEDYPFWHTLLTECGIEPVLSKSSTNSLYEKGIRSIVADNICFPAKLMHGHIMNLIEKKVDRLFYPWVVYERKEDEKSGNSFNCPVVSGYSDVIRASIQPEQKYGIPLDSPVINFQDLTLLTASCVDWLTALGVEKEVVISAVKKAYETQQRYLLSLEQKAQTVLQEAQKEGRMVILLAARPYHIDPLIEHKVSQSIADMGIDVITENVAAKAGKDVYEELNALTQWAYPNRIFKAASFAAKYQYRGLQMVELTSFGCGPDAFILDEVRAILSRQGKNLTVLKIDDVNNIGSLHLRIRSLVESVKSEERVESEQREPLVKTAVTTKPFAEEDRRRTILAPYFAEGYSEYLSSLFEVAGYKLVCLPMGNRQDAEEGLQDVNNDVCYPATITVGSLLRALKSGNYDLTKTAVAITQTGGQCRASNYYSLIKNALVKAGFADVPVVSVALGNGLNNSQPGFDIPWKKMWKILLYSLFFADTMQKLYYPAMAREKEKGTARRLYERYTEQAQVFVLKRDTDGLVSLARQAAADFADICDMQKSVPTVGLVGEIYVKYNSFSNLHVVDWLVEHGVEVVPPSITGFFLTKLPNVHINREQHIKQTELHPLMARLINRYVMHIAHRFDRACRSFGLYRPFADIYEISRLSRQVINPAADFGEGWFLSGEICHLAENGINKVVSVQPFGCIANHIISKGIEKRLKTVYPNLSLLFLDFDSGTSEANVQNRLHFMINQ